MSLDIWLEMLVDTGGEEPYHLMLYDGNITHNVSPMWQKAGVYEALYQSDGKLASEILPDLERGLEAMGKAPSEYVPLNPPNGWGDFNSAYDFLFRLTNAVRRNPKAIIGVSR